MAATVRPDRRGISIRILVIIAIATAALLADQWLVPSPKVAAPIELGILVASGISLALFAERYRIKALGLPVGRWWWIRGVVGGVVGILLFILDLVVFIYAFGPVGLVFAFLAPLGLFAVFWLVTVVRKNRRTSNQDHV